MVTYNCRLAGRIVFLCGLILLLAGCGVVTKASKGMGTSQTSTGIGIAPIRLNNGGSPQATVVVSHATVVGNRSGAGPIVISTPTISTEGGSSKQVVVLADRTLTFGAPSWSAGAVNTLQLNLSVRVENTGSKLISNVTTYYQIVSAEGDTFGLAAGTSSGFFGQMSGHTTHSGTLTFIVPAAAKNLRLLYRPEVVTETVLFPLQQ